MILDSSHAVANMMTSGGLHDRHVRSVELRVS